ncbi:isochorismatase family protein [Saccharopolyspora elongata]|uniref:Isochorismatase family protein n=1 Tax=Saccharopolyspora elongata TaxID=2530387 RepID=A0A4R4Y3Y4_9PSEU|nr:isochorismatase family protein [Saccharopolyspora elongata]TDD39101.1 isochorismatase family protein [Saccharopolyspora elongata]
MNGPRRALVVIDVQQEYFQGPLAVQYPPRDESLARIVRAVDTAVEAGVPVITVQHELPEGAPVFAAGSEGWQLHPEIERRSETASKHVVKGHSSVFTAGDLVEWLRANEIDTLTLVGYMTNNCVLATAAAAEPLGFAVEVLSDATGAIHLANEAGKVSAQQVHETLMVLLHSNWAAVADTGTWAVAVSGQKSLDKSDLGTSAVQGQAAH